MPSSDRESSWLPGSHSLYADNPSSRDLIRTKPSIHPQILRFHRRLYSWSRNHPERDLLSIHRLVLYYQWGLSGRDSALRGHQHLRLVSPFMLGRGWRQDGTLPTNRPVEKGHGHYHGRPLLHHTCPIEFQRNALDLHTAGREQHHQCQHERPGPTRNIRKTDPAKTRGSKRY